MKNKRKKTIDWSQVGYQKLVLHKCGFKWGSSDDPRFSNILQVFLEKDGPNHTALVDMLYDLWGKDFMELGMPVVKDDGTQTVAKPKNRIKSVDTEAYPSLFKLVPGAEALVSFNISIPKEFDSGAPCRERIPVFNLNPPDKPTERLAPEQDLIWDGKPVKKYIPVKSGEIGKMVLKITYPKDIKSMSNFFHFWKADMFGVLKNVWLDFDATVFDEPQEAEDTETEKDDSKTELLPF